MMRIAKTVTMLALVAALLAGTASAGQITINPNVGGTSNYDITGVEIWSNTNWYDLQAFVRVRDGATLIIEEGTCIVTTTGATQGSVFVCRGGQIFINGTEQNPVIFTSSVDKDGHADARCINAAGDGEEVYGGWTTLASHPTGKNPKSGKWHYGKTQATASALGANEWGSVAICGRGLISASHYGGLPVSPAIGGGNNPKTPSGTAQKDMEGVAPPEGQEDTIRYGGNDDYDDSGSISYVSLRYGGKVLALQSELNGLSLGGIGRETDVDHIEIMNNVDDGIEIWGGTVNLKYVSIWNIGDDSFDLDEGWRGKAQFGLIVQGFSTAAKQGSGVGDNCFEHDGAEDSDAQPCTTACIYNFTAIGQSGGDHGTAWRDNCHIQYHNCVWMDLGEALINNDGTDGDGAQGYGYNGTLTWAQAWTTNVESYWTAPLPPNSISQASQEAVYRDWTQEALAADANSTLCSIRDSLFYNNTYSSGSKKLDGLKGIQRSTTGGAIAAEVEFTDPGDQLLLKVDTGGGLGVEHTIDCSGGDANYDTLGEVADYIGQTTDTGLANWKVTLAAPRDTASNLLETTASSDCLADASPKKVDIKYVTTLTAYGEAIARGVLLADGDDADTLPEPAQGNVAQDLNSTRPIKDLTRCTPVVGGTWPKTIEGCAMLPVRKLDPRGAGSAVDADYCLPPDDSAQKGGRFWTQVRYKGAFSDDTNWLLGWTASDAYGMHAGYDPNPTEPTATVELKASVLTFTTQAGVKYVIEESSDGREWTQWAIVTGDGNTKNVSDFGTPSATKLYRVRPL